MISIKLPVTYLGLVRSGTTTFTTTDLIDSTGAVHPGLLDDKTEVSWRDMKSSKIDAVGPYRLEPGTSRSNANVKYATALILDVDQTTVDLARGWGSHLPHTALEGVRHYIVASPSNGWRKDNGRLVFDPGCYSWKIIYPLGDKLSGEALGKLQRAMVTFTRASMVEIDRATHDASRPCYRFQGAAPNFTASEFDGKILDIETIKTIVDEARDLDPVYVEGIASVSAGAKHDPTPYIVDRFQRKKGGVWWALMGECPIWLEDSPDEPTTVAELREELLLELDVGVEREKLCGTIFGGNTKRCLINIAGGMLTISDMKSGKHYCHRPAPEEGQSIWDRELPKTGRFDQSVAAQEMIEVYGDAVAVDTNQFPYLFAPETRTWDIDAKANSLIALSQGFSGRLTLQDKKGTWTRPWSWTIRAAEDIARTLCVNLARTEARTPWSGGIAFRDGLLLLDGTFRQRMAADFVGTRSMLPYDYEADAKCPRWERFLEEVIAEPLGELGPKAVLAVQMYLGACLAGRATECNVMMVLVGEGSNGKSVFLDVISSLFAPGTVACIEPSTWTNENALVQLYDAKVNIVPEVGQAKWRETGIIKRVLGGETVPMKHLYRDYFTAKPRAGHWFALNRLPSVWDDSHGWRRRARVVPFNRLFDVNEQDERLPAKLREELPGIALWALKGLRLAEKVGFKIPELESDAEEAWDASNRTSDLTFIDEWMRPGKTQYTAAQLYPFYRAHARSVGENPQPLRSFSMVLSRALAKSTMRQKTRVGSNRVWVYYVTELEMSLIDGSMPS